MLRNALFVTARLERHAPGRTPLSCAWTSTQAVIETEADGVLKREFDEAYKRKRRTEWKRRQRGQSFLDNLTVTVRGGKGGDGCVAFHREKYKPYGPPSGGNGGKGGDVYILPTPELTTLSSIPKRIRGRPGGNGQGTWMNGKNAPPTVIRVPVGTVVKELTGDDSRRAQDEWEAENEGLRNLSPSEKIAKMRERRWVHYPGSMDDNLEREAFLEAEKTLYRQERDKRLLRRERQSAPLFMDLDAPLSETSGAVSPGLEIEYQPVEDLGYLIASGGEGGVGNPVFLTTENRSPKFATRGTEGQRVTLSLELKILADIGLVGYPNAGKSTLLRALTGGRSKTEVAGYAFTTLNPSVGVVRMDDNGNVLGSTDESLVIDETKLEDERFKERMERGELAEVKTRNQLTSYAPLDSRETFRFSVADNPGLISHASEDVGLGHSFLRSIERSLALVYVVDLSGPEPAKELCILRDELEAYKSGLSNKARLVIANKADLLASDSEAAVEEAQEKLKRLEDFVRREMMSKAEHRHQIDESPVSPYQHLDVVPISAKFSQNLRKVLLLMRQYVEDAKRMN